MILLNELLQRPAAPFAHRARTIVDVVFTLTGRSNDTAAGQDKIHSSSAGNSNGGEGEVWQSLGRLRSKAWRAADIDPELTWTRPEAISVCDELYKGMMDPHQPHVGSDDAMDLATGADEAGEMPSNFWEGMSDPETGLGHFSLSARDWSDLNLEGFEDL